MSQTVEAIYDGKKLHLLEAVNLPPNAVVRLTIEVITDEKAKSGSFLDYAMSLNLEGPSDWSERLEDYLYDETLKPNA